jgi:hypothetical protein
LAISFWATESMIIGKDSSPSRCSWSKTSNSHISRSHNKRVLTRIHSPICFKSHFTLLILQVDVLIKPSQFEKSLEYFARICPKSDSRHRAIGRHQCS